MELFFILAAILVYIPFIKGECPSIDSLPVMNSDGTNFFCAKTWDGPGSPNAIEACNSLQEYPRELYKGSEMDGIGWTYYPMGSIIVKAGCVLHGWNGRSYTGALRSYPGPGVYPYGCLDSYNIDTCPIETGNGINAWGYHSFKCRCQQDPITCVPEDGWERIMTCDNSDGIAPMTCKYKKTIGTAYSTEVQNSMSIDLSIADALEASYFTLFSETLSISASTGYDWTHTSSETKSEEHSYEVDVEVPPGSVVMINGAIGRCGGSTSKTELFKIESYDQEGVLIAERYEGI